jgi:hypothetical protein
MSFMKAAVLFGAAAFGAIAPASVAEAQARDRCHDFANEMLSIDQRAAQLQCRPWTKRRVSYDVNYNWCQGASPSTVQDSINRWQSEFQRCQFQASGSPAAQPRPAARPTPRAAVGFGCPAPGSVRSQNSGQPATIQFVNNSFQTQKFYWLDYQGQLKFYKELKHGQSHTQRTYLTHPWVAIDPNGSCSSPFLATRAAGNRMEIR